MSEPAKDNKEEESSAARPRSAARLGAVQALYQMDLASTDLNDIIEEFSAYRFGQEVDGAQYSDADAAFFRSLVVGVVEHQKEIDPLLNGHLAEGWRLPRIDSILRAILRAGAFELIYRNDVPARVVISEYIDVAHAFFEGEEPKVVNGVLDRVARKCRENEIGRLANGESA